MPLAPHEQRVVDEEIALSEKLEKLSAFFDTQTFASLSDAEQVRMRAQSAFMSGYRDMLRARIAAMIPDRGAGQ